MFYQFCLIVLTGLLLVSCTGKGPADLKNTTRSIKEINPVCSTLNFEENLLTQSNILNLFECTGWNKTYPRLNEKIKTLNSDAFKNVSGPFGEIFFSTKQRRKEVLNSALENEKSGKLRDVSLLLNKWIKDYELITLLNLHFDNLNENDKKVFFNFIPNNNLKTLSYNEVFYDLFKNYSIFRDEVLTNISPSEKDVLDKRARILVNDLFNTLEKKNWNQIGGLFYDAEKSILRNWMSQGKDQDVTILLDTINEENFIKDVTYLNSSLLTGVNCSNKANERSFNIDVGYELSYKIDGLINGSKNDFEDKLIHGFSKFVAFREFCEESTKQQGLESFQGVINYALKVLESEHDYLFLKSMHQMFGDDKFQLLDFLSTETFFQLQELLSDKNSDRLIRSLYYVLSNLDLKSFITISKSLNNVADSKTNEAKWMEVYKLVWNKLSTKDQLRVIRLLGPMLSGEIDSHNIFLVMDDLLTRFPNLSHELDKTFRNVDFQNALIYFVKEFNDDEVTKDLAKLLSEDGLFEFISIMAGNTEEIKKQSQKETVKETISYVVESKSRVQRAEKVCYQDLYESYKKNVNYYAVVNTLPEACHGVIQNVGFVGQIYVWMFDANKYFIDTYGITDFHSGTGVWAPGMLQLIFSAAVSADQAMLSQTGKAGVLANVDLLHKELTNPALLETIHQGSLLYSNVQGLLDLEARIKNFLDSTPDEEIKDLLSKTFNALRPTSKRYTVNAIKNDCTKLSLELGANPCLLEKEMKESLTKIVEILKRKNGSDKSLFKNILAWLHPAGGISLPSGKYSTDLKEVIGFLKDLSTDQTKKSITYLDGDKTYTHDATIIERIEVVIRDISFLNNFYGAYFKNQVAEAKNYREDVTKSERLLVALERGSGVFRGVGSFPPETKLLLKNVRETYSSLIELSDNYEQADGTGQSYGNFIQSLLAAIQQSSKKKTQRFNAYRNPKPEMVNGHNGIFLTEVVKISGLRHLADYVNSRIRDPEILKTKEFKNINNLIGKFDLVPLQTRGQYLLDHYFNAGDNQLNIMLDDFVSLAYSLNDKEVNTLEEIALKILIIISDEKFDHSLLDDAGELVEVLIKNWPQLRMLLKAQTENRTELFEFINKLLDRLVQNPQDISGIIKTILSKEILKSIDLDLILNSSESIEILTKLLREFSRFSQEKFEINWFDVLKVMLNDPQIKLDALRAWMDSALSKNDTKLSLSVLIAEIGSKSQDGYRFKFLMDELLFRNKLRLEVFMQETFPSLKLNN